MIPDPYDGRTLVGLPSLDARILLPDTNEVEPRFWSLDDPWVRCVQAWRDHGFSHWHGVIPHEHYDPERVIRHLRMLTDPTIPGWYRPNSPDVVPRTALLTARWCRWVAYGPLGDASRREHIREVTDEPEAFDGFLTEWLDGVALAMEANQLR